MQNGFDFFENLCVYLLKNIMNVAKYSNQLNITSDNYLKLFDKEKPSQAIEQPEI